MMNTTVAINLVSIGRLVPVLNLLHDDIRKVAADLGIEPALRIDNREMYAEPDVERMKECVARKMAERATV